MLSTESVVDAGTRLLGRELTLHRVLTGGQHAVAVLVDDGHESFVVRAFPRFDDAVVREAFVLERVAALGDLVPQLVAYDTAAGHPVIVTSALPGSFPDRALPLQTIAGQMAGALARIHRLDGAGLRVTSPEPPTGESRLAVRLRSEWHRLDLSSRVLTHSDFWCGNALWDRDQLVGVVDWSGARLAPRGIDVAWCRQDLVLLGSPSAADHFLAEYEAHCGSALADVRVWDQLAAVHADPIVDTWAPNYAGINRPEITAAVLRRRLDEWTTTLS